jgi:hypothetical protein
MEQSLLMLGPRLRAENVGTVFLSTQIFCLLMVLRRAVHSDVFLFSVFSEEVQRMSNTMVLLELQKSLLSSSLKHKC